MNRLDPEMAKGVDDSSAKSSERRNNLRVRKTRLSIDESQAGLGPGFQLEDAAVYEDYWVDDGLLRPRGKLARLYRPAAYPQITTEFAELREGDEPAVIRFARTWGSFDYTMLVRRTQAYLVTIDRQEFDGILRNTEGTEILINKLKARAANVPLRNWEYGEPVEDADPLWWIWAHARGVRMCLKIVDLLAKEDTSHLVEYVRSIVDEGRGLEESDYFEEGSARVPLYGSGHRARNRISGVWDKRFTPDNWLGGWSEQLLLDFARKKPIVLARTILAEVVDRNLLGFHDVLEVTDDGTHLVFTKNGPLVSINYWHLARFAVGELGLGQCEECGKYFLRTDRRQRFCPPEDWLGKGAGSRCAAKARTRQYRQRASGSGEREK